MLVVNDFWLFVNGGWASCKYRGLTKCSKVVLKRWIGIHSGPRDQGPVEIQDPRTMGTQSLTILVTVLFNFHHILNDYSI